MDTIFSIAPLVGASLSVAIGVLGLIRPTAIAEGAGVTTSGPHGMAELRRAAAFAGCSRMSDRG